MKHFLYIAILFVGIAQSQDLPVPEKNKNPVGLAPSTWAMVSAYSGVYGTGVRPFFTNHTVENTNFIYWYTFNYTNFFVGTSRAVYTFDLSALDGSSEPRWSSFVFAARERTPNGKGSLLTYGVRLHDDGDNRYTLRGYAHVDSNPDIRAINVYDADDLENEAPFAHPEGAFHPNNQMIDVIPTRQGQLTFFEIDVTEEVRKDLWGIFVPTLGNLGLLLLLLGTAVTALYFLKRKGQ